jgi:hypothetical protein
MTSASAAEVVVTTMEVPTTAEGEPDRGPIPVIIGVGLIVIGCRIVAVPAKCPAAVPMATMAPAAPAVTVMHMLYGGILRHVQPGKTADRRC